MGGGGVVMNSNRAQWEAWWLGLQLEESRPWECSHIKACSFQHLEVDAGFQLGPSSPLFLSLPIWFDFPHSTEAGFQGKCPERARQKLYFFFFNLAALGLSCGMQDLSCCVWDLSCSMQDLQLQHERSSSLTRDRTPASLHGNAES